MNGLPTITQPGSSPTLWTVEMSSVPKRPEVEGRPRYDTRMMLMVLLWAYANGVRASRKIEERPHADVVSLCLAG
jgi:hypothetical protein